MITDMIFGRRERVRRESSKLAVGKMVSCSVEIEKLPFRCLSEKDGLNPGTRLRTDSKTLEMEAAVSALEYRVDKAARQVKYDKRACHIVRRAIAGIENITPAENKMILKTLDELDGKVRADTDILLELQQQLLTTRYQVQVARARRFTDSLRKSSLHQ